MAIRQTLHYRLLAALKKSRLFQGKGRTKERNSKREKSLKSDSHSTRTKKHVHLLEENIPNLNSSTWPICVSSYTSLLHRFGQLDGTGGVPPSTTRHEIKHNQLKLQDYCVWQWKAEIFHDGKHTQLSVTCARLSWAWLFNTSDITSAANASAAFLLITVLWLGSWNRRGPGPWLLSGWRRSRAPQDFLQTSNALQPLNREEGLYWLWSELSNFHGQFCTDR